MVSIPLDRKIYLLHRNLHLSAKRGLHEKKNIIIRLSDKTGGESVKVRIEIDENMSEDEIVIRCAQPDERVLKMKRAAESAEGDPEIAFFKDAVQFYPPLDSILFFETGEHNLNAHTSDDVFQVKMKLFELEEILPRKFVRVSKSAIVNVKHIYSVERNITSASLISFAGTHKQLYASRSYYKLLKLRLGERRFL